MENKKYICERVDLFAEILALGLDDEFKASKDQFITMLVQAKRTDDAAYLIHLDSNDWALGIFEAIVVYYDFYKTPFTQPRSSVSD